MKTQSQHSPSEPLSLILLALGVGGLLVLYKVILRSVHPLILLSVVMTGTALLYGASIYWSHGINRFKVGGRRLGLLLLLGICATALNGAMIWSVELSDAAQVSLLLRSDIIFSTFMGCLFFGERITRSGLSGLLLMSIGAFLVLQVLPWQLQIASKGDLLAILAGFLLSTNAVIIKYGLAKVPDEVVVFYNASLVAVLSFLLLAASGFLNLYTSLNSPGTAGLCGLAILFSAATFFLYYSNLTTHPVWVVRAFLLLSPFVTMVLGEWILHEPVVWSQWIGGGLLSGGGVVLLRDRKKRNHYHHKGVRPL